MKRLIEEEDYNEDESIDAAVNERKFLLQRMMTYAVVIDNSNTDMDYEQQLYIGLMCTADILEDEIR